MANTCNITLELHKETLVASDTNLQTQTHKIHHTCKMKNAQGDANTARALAVVRFGHLPPAVTTPQTGPITIHCAAAIQRAT